MDIYEVLNRIVTNRRFELSAHIFTQIDREELDEKDKQLFDILKNISSEVIDEEEKENMAELQKLEELEKQDIKNENDDIF